ncbi:MAG: ABC transporter substrate-binding protein [Candidatus Bathyarchaeia archaeon]
MSEKRGMSTVIAAVGIIVALIIGILGGYFLAPSKTATPTQSQLSGVLKIGAALPLTGDLATYGENAQIALTMAKNEINALLANSNAGYSYDIIFQDTQTKPELALTATQDLASKGCQVILGYYSSGELRNCMTYAQSNQLVLVSPSSTATSLAEPGVNRAFIYRFVPADDKQGPAMARGMIDNGISYIVPIWRGDTYGDGLVKATEDRFKALGGDYTTNQIRYNIDAKEFSSEVGVLAQEVQKAVDAKGKDKVGVYAVTFEEITSIMTSATQYPILSQVKWFGCDGQALSAKITSDPVVANFTTTVKFPATYFAPPQNDILTKVSNYVNSQVGHVPDPYAYGSYDSFYVVAKCVAFTQQYTGAAINKIFPTVSYSTYGASGWCALNEYGDRTIGDYEFWQVYQAPSGYTWYKAGLYTAGTDSVQWYPQP